MTGVSEPDETGRATGGPETGGPESGASTEGRVAGIRVALVLATSTGGVGQHVRSLAAGLVEHGAVVTVCGPAATEEQFRFTATGASFRPVEIAAGLRPGHDASAVAALARQLGDAEIVHAHGLRAGLVAALARRASRLRPFRAAGVRPGGALAPLVVTWHNVVLADGWQAGVYAQLERLVARSADITLCASGDLLGRVLRLGGRDVRPAPVAAPPLPEPSRDPVEVRTELLGPERAANPLVLSVGRLHPQKGYDTLVAAAARWRDLTPRPIVVIAGSGPSEAELHAKIAASGAPVQLLGHRADVADLLAAADLAVVTSQWEARQLFAQEALRAGRPLVATAVGGIPELVGDAAVLIPAGDVDALDAAVRKLLENPDLRAGYVDRGLARAATWPTERDTVAQIEAVYAELLGRGG